MSEEEKEYWQKYFDDYISHAIGAVEYGNYFYDQIKDMVLSAKEDCNSILEKYIRCGTKKRYKELEREIKDRLVELEDEVAQFIALELPLIIDNENKWLDNNVAPYLNVKLDKVVNSVILLGMIPIATAGSANNLGKNISGKLQSIYNQLITQSYITDIPFDELEEDYSPRFSAFERGLQADVETIGSSLSSQYDRIVFTKNDKKINRYVWTSILDTGTCLYCGSLDGQIFDDITKAPIYPPHDRCRCRLLPLPEDLDIEDIKETYSEWLARQDKATQYKALGKTRFQLYEQGMKIKQFVNNGKITPLKNLK